MEEILVSVIIPVYNTEMYLSECMESVIHQTYKNLEIILVDDGSTDNCSLICDEYEKKDYRVRVIHKENEGASKARETGILATHGSYIMFIDSDDWIDLETIQSCVEMAEHDRSDCVLFSYIKEYRKKSIPNRLFDEDFHYGKIEAEEKVHRRIIGFRKEELQYPEKIDNLSPMFGKLYKRQTAKKGKIVSEREVGTSEDTVFNIYALDKCKNISYLNKCFYHYRKVNAQSITTCYKPKLYEQWNRLYKIFEEYIQQAERRQDYYEVFLNRVACGMIGLGLNEASGIHGFWEKAGNIQRILKDPLYRKAFEQLDYSYCPLKWKIFFQLCKWHSAQFLTLLLLLMNQLRKRSI